jgi:hypothetical protein
MKKQATENTLLAGIAALFLATGTAQSEELLKTTLPLMPQV